MDNFFNKRGVDRTVSVYWFVIVIIAASGIFLMVYAFYNSPYDVRELEAEVLGAKIADCISQKAVLKTELKNYGNFNENYQESFSKNCNLNLDQEYFVKASFFTVENTTQPVYVLDAGNKNYESFCNVQNNKEFEKLPKCITKRFYSLDYQSKQNLVEILSVVNKVDQNVRK